MSSLEIECPVSTSTDTAEVVDWVVDISSDFGWDERSALLEKQVYALNKEIRYMNPLPFRLGWEWDFNSCVNDAPAFTICNKGKQ